MCVGGNNKFCKFLEAKKTRRRPRVLGEVAAVLGTRAHLVLPAIAKFWRMDLYKSTKTMEERVEKAKVHGNPTYFYHPSAMMVTFNLSVCVTTGWSKAAQVL